jgi:hypothetical protein
VLLPLLLLPLLLPLLLLPLLLLQEQQRWQEQDQEQEPPCGDPKQHQHRSQMRRCFAVKHSI